MTRTDRFLLHLVYPAVTVGALYLLVFVADVGIA